ncbi:MAG TPA: alpha/beta hydrolase [Ramlibacter sp.]|jgi:pimeloyl-ACP methyl ester carboxylesterase|nr:alpha/beta hydrolase [Ramlibacter sp.]
MTPCSRRRFLLPALSLPVLGACASLPAPARAVLETSQLRVSPQLQLRRLVVRNERAAGTVLLLHGFPETILAWKGIAEDLGGAYEVHAFDWPGYGQSTRPPAQHFSYAPREYARVLEAYIEAAGIDSARLTIYATDIGALPALLLALEKPAIARRIIVGDFAPFDRPQYMHASLQSLKKRRGSEVTRSLMNRNRDEIVHNAYRRGLSEQQQFDIPREFTQDMLRGWDHPEMSSADGFFHYYSHFDEDQHYFESSLARLRTPVKVLWGERDFYIHPAMGVEFAVKAGLKLEILRDIGHYPHLQSPAATVREIRASFRG